VHEICYKTHTHTFPDTPNYILTFIYGHQETVNFISVLSVVSSHNVIVACCMSCLHVVRRRISNKKKPNLCWRDSDLETAEDLYHRRITRIVTSDFPKYFALVTRVRHDTELLGPEGGAMSSRVNPQVQAVFPPKSLTKPIKVGLQVNEN